MIIKISRNYKRIKRIGRDLLTGVTLFAWSKELRAKSKVVRAERRKQRAKGAKGSLGLGDDMF